MTRSAANSAALPLAGRRVIELGTMIAAPFSTHILAQLGAEVIKIEPPSGDTTRNLVRGGPSGTFIAYNHGKKSLCLDLASAEGRDVFRKLAASADAVIHNLSPAAARKLGVTAEALEPLNPQLIVCHISGYGPGPQADDLATNPVAEAATGVMDDHRIDGRPSRLYTTSGFGHWFPFRFGCPTEMPLVVLEGRRSGRIDAA